MAAPHAPNVPTSSAKRIASALIRAGLNAQVVAQRLGHANAAMTLNVYAHLWPDDEDRTREAVDSAPSLSPAVPTMCPEEQSCGSGEGENGATHR